jgi:hypothetical protein
MAQVERDTYRWLREAQGSSEDLVEGIAPKGAPAFHLTTGTIRAAEGPGVGRHRYAPALPPPSVSAYAPQAHSSAFTAASGRVSPPEVRSAAYERLARERQDASMPLHGDFFETTRDSNAAKRGAGFPHAPTYSSPPTDNRFASSSTHMPRMPTSSSLSSSSVPTMLTPESHPSSMRSRNGQPLPSFTSFSSLPPPAPYAHHEDGVADDASEIVSLVPPKVQVKVKRPGSAPVSGRGSQGPSSQTTTTFSPYMLSTSQASSLSSSTQLMLSSAQSSSAAAPPQHARGSSSRPSSAASRRDSGRHPLVVPATAPASAAWGARGKSAAATSAAVPAAAGGSIALERARAVYAPLSGPSNSSSMRPARPSSAPGKR